MKAVLLFFVLIPCSGFIIMRHDKSDEEFKNLAKEFERSVANLALPDGNATFIKKDWLLTAAHVAVEIKEKLAKAEPHTINFDGKKYAVDKVIIHEKWNQNKRYDLALVHLSQPIETAVPVALYTKQDELNKFIYIVGNAGIGNGKDGVKEKTDWCYRAATNRIDVVTDYFVKFTFDSPDAVSANLTELEGVSGPGDSGGPAFVKEGDQLYLIGVGSTQSTKNTNGVEGVYGAVEQYVRVSQYLKWIDDNLK